MCLPMHAVGAGRWRSDFILANEKNFKSLGVQQPAEDAGQVNVVGVGAGKRYFLPEKI